MHIFAIVCFLFLPASLIFNFWLFLFFHFLLLYPAGDKYFVWKISFHTFSWRIFPLCLDFWIISFWYVKDIIPLSSFPGVFIAKWVVKLYVVLLKTLSWKFKFGSCKIIFHFFWLLQFLSLFLIFSSFITICIDVNFFFVSHIGIKSHLNLWCHIFH